MKLKNTISWKKFGTKSATFFLVALLVFFATSCGGKRSTAKSRIDIKADSIKINNNIVLTQNSALYDVISFVPIDNAKPIILNGVAYYNASIKFDKSKFENLELKDLSSLSYSSTDRLEKNKETEKTDNTLLYIGLAFVVCLFVFLWFYLPRIKLSTHFQQ